ncbi:MAG: Nif3-like dinuclear metal center hexameric protein [Acidobacteriota bacterium]
MPQGEDSTVNFTRRHFSLAAGATLAAGETALAQSGKVTAQQVIDRIQKQLADAGVAWKTPTRDVFKAGDPGTEVTGIATTVMSTLSILQRAAKAGRNLIITHEPTFWSDGDGTQELANDAVYRFKADFIRKNNLVVWRFHDHWHAKKPDAMMAGLAQDLGWTEAADAKRTYNIRPTTLGAVVKDMQERLKFRAIRVIGNPDTKISKGALSVGATSLQAVLRGMPEVDLYVAGEPREWEGPEYAQDAVAMGQNKAMIMIGHQNSEDPGMRLCADWLKTFVTEVPVEWIPTSDPFWRPA